MKTLLLNIIFFLCTAPSFGQISQSSPTPNTGNANQVPMAQDQSIYYPPSSNPNSTINLTNPTNGVIQQQPLNNQGTNSFNSMVPNNNYIPNPTPQNQPSYIPNGIPSPSPTPSSDF